jgi:hypothetical protein
MSVGNQGVIENAMATVADVAKADGPRRGRIVVTTKTSSAPRATGLAIAKPKQGDSAAKAKKAPPAKEIKTLCVYHLSEATNPGGPERVSVQKEGQPDSFLLHLSDNKHLQWAFEDAPANEVGIRLEYFAPGEAETPRVVRTSGQTYLHSFGETMAGMLYLFMRFVPREA